MGANKLRGTGTSACTGCTVVDQLKTCLGHVLVVGVGSGARYCMVARVAMTTGLRTLTIAVTTARIGVSANAISRRFTVFVIGLWAHK